MATNDKSGRVDREEYAPLSVVERHHTENKAFRDEHYKTHLHLHEQMTILTEQLKAHTEADRKAFEALEEQIVKVTGAISWPIWKVVSVLAAVIMTVSGLIWAAARYPDRNQFNALEVKVEQLQVEQALLHQSFDITKSSIDRKLDLLLKKYDPP